MNDKLISQIKLLLFDFDGVLTNNKVYVNEKGEESVVCDRADGLAFRALKKIGIETFIVSTEKNEVVKKRISTFSFNTNSIQQSISPCRFYLCIFIILEIRFWKGSRLKKNCCIPGWR